MNKDKKSLLCRLSGHCLTVGAPLAATATQFPIWIHRGSSETVCGTALFLMIVSAIPLYKAFKDKLKTPSAFLVWLILFLFIATLKPIVEQLYIVSLVGVISGGAGTVLYKVAERVKGALPAEKESEK